MIFHYLNTDIFMIKQFNISFIIKLSNDKDLLLLNCTDGCQSNIFNQYFKINNLSKIVVTDLHINNISGLLGLLSSLNLIGRTKALHIYAHIDLKYYLDLGKKYSQTNFSYSIYIHTLKAGIIINEYGFRLYTFIKNNCYEFIIIQSEQCGTFFLNKAENNYIMPGPLYGRLKKGSNFILPDGFNLNGNHLTSKSLCGKKLCFFVSSYYNRRILENSMKSRIVLLA